MRKVIAQPQFTLYVNWGKKSGALFLRNSYGIEFEIVYVKAMSASITNRFPFHAYNGRPYPKEAAVCYYDQILDDETHR